MRTAGSSNKTIHWIICDLKSKNKTEYGFTNAVKASQFLNVSPQFIYDFNNPRKKFTSDYQTFVNSKGYHVKRRGKYYDLLHRYSIRKKV